MSHSLVRGVLIRLIAAAATGLLICVPRATAAPTTSPVNAPMTILVSADTEGHVSPCQSCPMHAGRGGLARRATAISKARAEGPVLLLDAGNFLFGSDSMASKGNVIVAAYQALGYDAVNLSYRDFRLGKAHTLELLAAVKTPVSANLLDDITGKTLVAPYVVRKLGGQRIALIGITELPAGFDLLPHFKQQLAGIRIRPAPEALDEWIPKAQAESDQVVLMYYGPSAGLQRILSSNHAAALALIAVGNIRPEQVPTGTKLPIVASDEHGKDLGRASPAAGGAAVEQVILDDSVAADPAMTTLLAR